MKTKSSARGIVQQRARLGRALNHVARAGRVLEQGLGPLLALGLRLWIAQAFFVSGVLKLAHWDNALYLATYEYPVPWMAPGTAAVLGVTVEVVGSVLLATGLATRLAAVPMLVLALVIQASYRALDVHLLWAAGLAWLTLRGAGALSLDALVRKGVSDSPLPLARSVARGFVWTTRAVLPVYEAAWRLWIASAIAGVAGMALLGATPPTSAWFPAEFAPALPPSLALVLAVLWSAGAVTRLAALTLLVLVAGSAMAEAATPATTGWLLVAGLFLANGAGRLSIDGWLTARLRRSFPELSGRPAFSLEGLPRVVVVGAGFGGLACTRALANERVQVTVIDRNNYHLFQPLLYQVATAGLSPGDIATPVREVLRDQFNARVLYGTVTGIDTAQRQVRLAGGSVPYDYLVLATGASHSYFGRDEWAPHAPGLKRVEDATAVRARLLAAFEHAEATDDPEDRAALLTVVVVGGGPTGVELAGAIAELARFGMEKDFRRFDPAATRVLLIQAGPRLLPAFPEALSVDARRSLEALGVEVVLDSRVEGIDPQGVTVDGRRIPTRTVLWAAGVVASPAARWVGAASDRAGRVVVGPDLTVPGMPAIYAIGDTAASDAWDGRPVPGLAPAAKQAGIYAARHIAARVNGSGAPVAFRYRHLGSLATIGRKAAVADFGRVRLRGAVAWWLWGVVHVGFLAGTRNRISVMLDWCWAYLTFRSGVRLITGADSDSPRTTAALERAAA